MLLSVLPLQELYQLVVLLLVVLVLLLVLPCTSNMGASRTVPLQCQYTFGCRYSCRLQPGAPPTGLWHQHQQNQHCWMMVLHHLQQQQCCC